MCSLSIDLRGSGNPIDDLRAINNCYSALTGMMLDGGELNHENMAE